MVQGLSTVLAVPAGCCNAGAKDADLFDHADRPTCRATCRTLATERGCGPATRLHFAASHSLVEGADLAAVLRGRMDRRVRRPKVPHTLSGFSRMGLALVAPVLAIVHALTAKAERRKPDDFHFASIEMDRADLVAAADRLKIGKRALLFALALFPLAGARPRKRAVQFVYSKLPARQYHLEDDDYLSVRMQFLAAQTSDDFVVFARQLAHALERQNETEVLTQFLSNRILSVHRRIAAVFPWLYRGAFFGFAPYDMVLSLVPPIAPAGPFSALAEARMFGRSYTGTAPSVIFLWDTRRIT